MHVEQTSPPTMTVCLVGRPYRFVTLQFECHGTTPIEIERAATTEVETTHPALFDLLALPRH
jgi:hypothetical protein